MSDCNHEWIDRVNFYKPEVICLHCREKANADEIATLRQQLTSAQAENEALRTALKEIANWTDRWTAPGHPVSTIARAALERQSEGGE